MLLGKRPGEDVEITYTGLRPGEKRSEELFYLEEALLPTGHPKIRLTAGTCVDTTHFHEQLNHLWNLWTDDDERALAAALWEVIGTSGARSVSWASGQRLESNA